MNEPRPARLRAIIAVDSSRPVRCQQSGCHRSVYAAVHVVEEAGQLLVLGSTCFAKRYGGGKALGGAQYGGGSGRKLSDEERQILLNNTAALIAHFEEQDRARAAALALAAEQRRAQQRVIEEQISLGQEHIARAQAEHAARARQPGLPPAAPASPWPWQSERNTSVAVLTAPDGTAWVRVQHRDGSQKLMPWPVFPGWDTALPPEVGRPDPDVQGYTVADISFALGLLQARGFSKPNVGRWRDVQPRRR